MPAKISHVLFAPDAPPDWTLDASDDWAPSCCCKSVCAAACDWPALAVVASIAACAESTTCWALPPARLRADCATSCSALMAPPSVKVIFEPINQIARARNAGASIATGDWLVFVDADSHPSVELFADVAEQVSAGKVLAGGVTIRLDEKLFVAGLITQFWNYSSRLTRLMAGSFIFVEAAAFRQVGTFSHEFYAAEELDLSLRLKKLARETKRKIVILHRAPIKTSARKVKLYTGRELGGFFLRSIFNHRKTIRDREAAFMWYDGRR